MNLKYIIGLAVVLLGNFAGAQNQNQNPFLPPSATVHWERDREYDLKHVAVNLKVDWPHRQLTGSVTHTLAPLRSGLATLSFDAGASLKIKRVTVNGAETAFEHPGDKLIIHLSNAHPRDADV